MPRVAAVRARHGRPAQASQPEFGNVFQFNPGSGVPPQPSQAGTGPQPNGAAPEPPPQPTPGPRVYDIEPEYVS
jgi:hypothetical protein